MNFLPRRMILEIIPGKVASISIRDWRMVFRQTNDVTSTKTPKTQPQTVIMKLTGHRDAQCHNERLSSVAPPLLLPEQTANKRLKFPAALGDRRNEGNTIGVIDWTMHDDTKKRRACPHSVRIASDPYYW